MTLPDGFADEYWQMRERFEWAKQLGGSMNPQQAKASAADMRDFLDRWAGQINEPEIEAGLKEFARAVTRIERALDAKFWLALQEVVVVRKDWLLAELFFDMSQTMIRLFKDVPAQLRPGLEKIYRDHMHREYDPTDYFQREQADADEAEKKYRQALTNLEVDWPERLSPEIRQRLDKPTPDDLNAWLAELGGKTAESS